MFFFTTIIFHKNFLFFKSSIFVLVSNEYNCLSDFVTKFNLQDKYSKKSTGYYDFCFQGFSCLNLKIQKVNITGTSLSTEVLSNDLICLQSFNQIVLNDFAISLDLLYYSFPQTIDSITYNRVVGTTIINQPLPICNTFLFNSFQINNTILKLSNLNNIKTFILSGGYVYLDNDIPSGGTTTSNILSITANSLNYPNFLTTPNLNIELKFNENFVKSSIANFSTISSNSIVIISHLLNINSIVPFYLNTSIKISKLTISAFFEKPSGIINLAGKGYSYERVKLLNVGPDFIFNGQFPVIFEQYTSVEVYNTIYTSFPPLEKFNSLKMINAGLNTNLPPFSGSGFGFDFSNNQITGTVDKTWCKTVLTVTNNQLTGDIPSCFLCYMNDPDIFLNFKGNQFSNFTQNCPNFEPRFKILNYEIANFEVSGYNIGTNPGNWILNGTYTAYNYATLIPGQIYRVSYLANINGLKYVKVFFPNPLPSRYFTFPIVFQKPTPTVVQITNSGSTLLIEGNFFSTYLGYVGQNVTISNQNCEIYESSFFNIKCNFNPPLVQDNNLNVLTIITNSTTEKVLINKKVLNNQTCSPECLDDFLCDMSVGQCKSYIECPNNSCGGNGYCNYSIGACNCNKNFQGNDCSLSYIECTGCQFGLCNNQTGICICSDNYSGNDCSVPNYFISSINPSSTAGGDASFNGWFSNFHSNLTLKIGDLPCYPFSIISTTTLICSAPPGRGIKDIHLFQNNINYTLIGKYFYVDPTKACINDCYSSLNQGECNLDTGICNCNPGFGSFDCGAIDNNNNNNNPSNTTIDQSTGETTISNDNTNFQIYLKSLFEIDINDNIVNQYSLQNSWTTSFNKTSIENQYSFKQYILQNNNQIKFTIECLIEEIINPIGKEYSFAGTNFKIEIGGVKLTISINNYIYSSNLNTLQLQLISLVNDGNHGEQSELNKCNQKDTSIDINNVNNLSEFNYIKISKNNKVFAGRFLNKFLSDGKSTYLSTKVINDSNSITISLDLPHCVSSCIIDPDFSVLLSTKFSGCEDDPRPMWLIPIVVILPLAAVATIVAIAILIYRKKFVENDLELKLKRANTEKKN